MYAKKKHQEADLFDTSFPYSSIGKMQAVCSSETSLILWITQHYTTEHNTVRGQGDENLKSNTSLFFLFSEY